MTTKIIGKSLLVVCVFSMLGCASNDVAEDSYIVERKRPASAAEAARILGCTDDQVAVCIETNCEIEEYYCAKREDVRKMFRAGDFRHDVE